ncbi:sigma-70 family RNA polymerase sigma factor [Yoonia sp. SS1-5]|uniref:RNA polymerase sigma factor n=1 Tax=Yoonia rhodophyticola TaxID=3137370 RepID=A0AAN0M933_9RHOB
MGSSNNQTDPRDEIVEHIPDMRAFALNLTRNPTLADDLVQDALVKAWRKFHQFQAGTNLRAWLFTILRNTFYSEIRKNKNDFGENGQDLDELASIMHGQDAQIALIDFEKALGLLPTEQREALILVAAIGMSYDEAAETCGVAMGTIKSRINRGRKRLAELLYGDAPIPAEEAE